METTNSDANIYYLNTDPLTFPDSNGRVLIGQFTTDGTLSGNLNFVVDDDLGQQHYINANIPSVITINSKNENADNYCEECVEDNNLCYIPGCTNSSANNYNTDANFDDGSCILTCLDENACNYGLVGQCVVDDPDGLLSGFGGCVSAIAALGCDFVFGGAPISETCPVSCSDCPVYGCTDINACNFDATATEDDGSCQGFDDPDGLVSGFGGCVGAIAALGCDFVFGGAPISETCPVSLRGKYCDELTQDIFGCTNAAADNYNSDATVDDGSCQFSGCTDSTACNYDVNANVDDVVHVYCPHKDL